MGKYITIVCGIFMIIFAPFTPLTPQFVVTGIISCVIGLHRLNSGEPSPPKYILPDIKTGDTKELRGEKSQGQDYE